MNKLSRSSDGKVLAGVCSGLAIYLNLDAGLIRLIFILLAVFGQSALIIYGLLWLFLPIDETGPRGFDEIKGAFSK